MRKIPRWEEGNAIWGNRPGPTTDLRLFAEAVDRKIDEVLKRLALIERKMKKMASQLEELDAKLDAVAAMETKLGTDIQAVVDFLKSNPNPTPTDLTAQLAKLDTIAQTLIDTDATTLANLPPTP